MEKKVFSDIINWITANNLREGLAVIVGIIALVYIFKAEGAYEKILRLFFVLLGILFAYFVVVAIYSLS